MLASQKGQNNRIWAERGSKNWTQWGKTEKNFPTQQRGGSAGGLLMNLKGEGVPQRIQRKFG